MSPPDAAPAPEPAPPVGSPAWAGPALAAARAAAVGRLAALTDGFDDLVAASRDSNADDEHDPEGATIAFERSQLDSLTTRSRRQLAEIDAALDRLAQGRYGRCEGCGGRVAPARLEALPATRLCVGCAAASGRAGRPGRPARPIG